MNCPRKLTLAALCAALAQSTLARAQSTPSKRSDGISQQNVVSDGDQESRAQELFEQARAEMLKKDFERACPKLRESLRLVAAVGTQLNLAICHQAIGSLASAWLEYVEAIYAEPSLSAEYGPYARAIEERIRNSQYSKLKFELPKSQIGGRLEVTLNGVHLSEPSLSRELPLDPGKHEVVVRNAERVIQRKELTVYPSQAQDYVIRVTLAPAPPNPSRDGATHGPADITPREKPPIPTAVYVGIGITSGLAVGAVLTGIVAENRRDSYNEKNSDPTYSAGEREAARASTRDMQYLNTGLVGGAAIAAVVTFILFLNRPQEDSKVGQVTRHLTAVSPWLVPQGAGLSFSGRIE